SSFSLYSPLIITTLYTFPTRRSSDLQRVKAVRQVIGEETKLLMDANCSYRFFEAIEFGKMVEEYHPYWFEEPVDADDYDGFRKRSEEHTSELQSRFDLVCRLLLEKKK